MRCHLCGEKVKAVKLETHLRANHKSYYSSPINYAFLTHKTKYGNERAKFIISSLFKNKRKLL